MNAVDFVPFLGKGSDSAQVKQLLSALGVTKAPACAGDEVEVYVEVPHLGVVLVFEKPESTTALPLTLADVQFSSGEGAAFSGALPEGLSFEDSQAVAHQKLGPADGAVDGVFDCWQRDGYFINLEYEPRFTSIRVVELTVIDLAFEPN